MLRKTFIWCFIVLTFFTIDVFIIYSLIYSCIGVSEQTEEPSDWCRRETTGRSDALSHSCDSFPLLCGRSGSPEYLPSMCIYLTRE